MVNTKQEHAEYISCKMQKKADVFFLYVNTQQFKGGYLDFSHLTELENIFITEIYMRKQYKSSITKNHKIIQKYFLMVFP